jgi:hypothetical protein
MIAGGTENGKLQRDVKAKVSKQQRSASKCKRRANVFLTAVGGRKQTVIGIIPH